MSPQLEAVIIATLGALIVVAAIIAWALYRLARSGDRWTEAANTLGRRVTDHDNRLTALEATGIAQRAGDAATGLSGAVAGNQRQGSR